MVAISFIEKLLKRDAEKKEYEVHVIGDEPHLAYNRVGLTSFFQSRSVDQLYMKPKDWVSRLNLWLINAEWNSMNHLILVS